MPDLTVRLWPTADPVGADDVDALLAEARPTLDRVDWGAGALQSAGPEGEGHLLSMRLADDDPDAMIRDVRQALGVAKWLAVRRPEWWVEVWDDLGLVEATFGVLPSLLGGGAVDRETGEPAPAVEQKLAEQVAKVWLVGLDLGLPPGVPDEVVAAADGGVDPALQGDEAFARAALAAIDRCGRLRRDAAAERLAVVLDALDGDLVRRLVLERFEDHAHAARRRLGPLLAAMEDRRAAIDAGIDLLFSVPKATALDDAAEALASFCEDPELVATLAGVVDDEAVSPGPGARVDGACADLLLRTAEGALAVARRARRDRDADPIAWWAVRKLLEHPRPETVPTALLYARPGASVPGWLDAALDRLGDPRRPAGGRLTEADASALFAEEAARLG